MVKTCYVYIMANPWSRVLYTGVTGDLVARVRRHKDRATPGFTQRYNVTGLVYFEQFDGPRDAIAREKEIKSWLRHRKLDLIESVNPGFDDLSDGWYDGVSASETDAGFLQNDVKDLQAESDSAWPQR